MIVREATAVEGGDPGFADGLLVSRELVARQIEAVRGRPELVLSEGAVRDRTAVYVPAGNHDEIERTLRLYRFVVLAGPPGAGVGTTAVALLGRLLPAARVRRFSVERDDAEEAAPPEEGGGYIVRARESEPSRLRAFLAAVRASRGYAVVVGTAEEQRRLTGLPAPITVEPPPAEEVYRSHLRHRRVPRRWLDWARGRELLEDASPGDASRLAGLVAEISVKGGGEREVERAYRTGPRRGGRVDPEQVIRQAREWTEGPRRDADLAYTVLAEACLDPLAGGRVREALHEWSRQSRTPQALKLAVARVCQVVGQAYPAVALSRLMQLATRGDAQVRREVAEAAVGLAEQDASAVFTAALRWVRSIRELPPRSAVARLDAAMRILPALLPAFGEAGTRRVLEAVDAVVVQGDPRLRPRLLKHLQDLAEGRVLPVLVFSLEQSGDHDSPPERQAFGTGLFLSLVASARPEELPALLAKGIDPLDAVTAWALAMESPADFPDFPEALTRWLDLAEADPDLIDPLYAAAWHRAETRRLLTDLVTGWADGRPERRRVGDAILVHILLPEWRRRLLAVRLRLRRAASR
jgi:hypothetical protein